MLALEPHPHAAAVLGAALAPERGPAHAYLLHGPAGTGKREAARAFAAELLSRGARDPENARVRVAHGSHPDLTWVAPSGAHEMLRRDVDEAVVSAAAHTPFEAAWRVFVIERADTMNDEAANALLKTLEEPPPYVVLMLLTDRLTQVLPTIASRCQPVRFDALGSAAVAERLQSRGVEPAAALACARLSLGDGEKALALALGDGPALREAAELLARAPLHGRAGERPWRAVLERARGRGGQAREEVEQALAEELQYLPKKEHKRRETEFGERARRAERLQSRGVEPDAALACARLSLGDGEKALALGLAEGPALRAHAEAVARAPLAGKAGEQPWQALLETSRERGRRARETVEAALAEELAFLPKKEHRKRQTEFGERAKRAERRATTGALDQALQLIGLWYRDLACVAAGAPELAHHSDRIQALEEDAAERDADRLREAVELVDDARARLALNVDPQLSFEALAYRLERLLN